MAGFVEKRNGPLSTGKRPFTLSDGLKRLSSFGMFYDDLVLRQSQAIGPTEDAFGYGQMNPMGVDNDDIYSAFAALSMTDTGMRKQIPFFDKNYETKRAELRQFSLQDEVEDILDILCDETVVYDEKNFFCYPDIIGLDVSDDVDAYFKRSFREIYQYFGFTQDQSAWYFFRKFLIDGYLAFEIIYSPDQKNIIGFKEIDPVTLMPGYNKEDGKKVWIQFKDDPMKERVLYDSQIIYISYSSITTASRVSYVERLIRAFNLMRIMEHTRVIWAVTNASFRMKFVIPMGGKSKTRAKQSLAQLMNNYKEVVDFDWESASLQTDGKPMMQFNKEYWLPSKEGESPEIETLGGDGPDLSDTEALKYFNDKLKAVSKIPFNRFMYEDGGGEFNLAADGMIRDEIKFSKFIRRLRSAFQEILVKPLYIQMCLKYPEFTNDASFRTQIALRFNEENMFAELKNMEIMERRIEFIGQLKDNLSISDPATMSETPYFDLDFLVDRYLKLSPDDKEANDAYKKRAEADKAGDDDDPMGMLGGLGGGAGLGGF
jgi:hypothetical protein